MCIAILTCPFPIVLAGPTKVCRNCPCQLFKPSKAQKTGVKSSCPKALPRSWRRLNIPGLSCPVVFCSPDQGLLCSVNQKQLKKDISHPCGAARCVIYRTCYVLMRCPLSMMPARSVHCVNIFEMWSTWVNVPWVFGELDRTNNSLVHLAQICGSFFSSGNKMSALF